MHDPLGVCSGQRGTDLARDDQRLVDRQRTVIETPLQCSATQPPHDEVCRVGVAPEVDQRHDVGMFDPRNHSGLGFESADEIGLRCQFRSDLFDRHFTLD